MYTHIHTYVHRVKQKGISCLCMKLMYIAYGKTLNYEISRESPGKARMWILTIQKGQHLESEEWLPKRDIRKCSIQV